jgi:hypothetical protein
MKTTDRLSRLTTISLLTVVLLACCSATAFTDDSPYKIRLDSLPNQYLGHDVYIGATLMASDTVHGFTGFDLTIAYDRGGMNFRDVFPGNIISDCDWEYFTYQWGRNGDCHGDCPEGVVRIVGIANLLGDPPVCISPIPGVGTVPKTLFTLKVLLTTNHTYDCSEIPIRWYWLDCRDNVIQTTDTDEQVISARVFDQTPIGPYEITDSTMGFPSYFGAQTVCSTPAEGYATRAVDFYNTYVPTACADSIDYRGDLNLNAISYEIADYVLFTSYFMNGLSVFTVNPPLQIATSDVNADGIELHVSDLVYLGLVIVGDALPVTKVNASESTVEAVFTAIGDTVYLQTSVPLGGVFLKFPGKVQPTILQTGGEFYLNYDGTNTNVLIVGHDDFRPSHLQSGPLLSIVPFLPWGIGVPMLAQASDTLGMYVPATIDSPTGVEDGSDGNLPLQFALEQNYPNPFNPTTTISFTLPRASDYILTVFNMLGQPVQTFTGNSPAGQVTIIWDAGDQPSGVYLYRLQAGVYSDSRKMLLIK